MFLLGIKLIISDCRSNKCLVPNFRQAICPTNVDLIRWCIYPSQSVTFCFADFDGLVQDCGYSIAKVLELLQSCTKPSNYYMPIAVEMCMSLIVSKRDRAIDFSFMSVSQGSMAAQTTPTIYFDFNHLIAGFQTIYFDLFFISNETSFEVGSIQLIIEI